MGLDDPGRPAPGLTRPAVAEHAPDALVEAHRPQHRGVLADGDRSGLLPHPQQRQHLVRVELGRGQHLVDGVGPQVRQRDPVARQAQGLYPLHLRRRDAEGALHLVRDVVLVVLDRLRGLAHEVEVDGDAPVVDALADAVDDALALFPRVTKLGVDTDLGAHVLRAVAAEALQVRGCDVEPARHPLHQALAFLILALRVAECGGGAVERGRQVARHRERLRVVPLVRVHTREAVTRHRDHLPDDALELRVPCGEFAAVRYPRQQRLRQRHAGEPRHRLFTFKGVAHAQDAGARVLGVREHADLLQVEVAAGLEVKVSRLHLIVRGKKGTAEAAPTSEDTQSNIEPGVSASNPSS